MNRQQRRFNNQRVIKKQTRILDQHGFIGRSLPPGKRGSLRKTHGLHCGNSGCSVCGRERAAKRKPGIRDQAALKHVSVDNGGRVTHKTTRLTAKNVLAKIRTD